jgi:hypothetical protein
MAAAPPAADPHPKPASKLQPVLPEERFWVRYSPHHEMPLSGVSSFAVHALALGLLVIGYFLLPSPFKKHDQIPFEPVSIAGSSDNKGGPGVGPGAPGAMPEENLGNEKGKQPEKPEGTKQPLPNLPDATASLVPFKADNGAVRPIQGGNENIDRFVQLDQQLKNSLRQGSNGSPDQRGPGTGGGRDRGNDKGVSPNPGPNRRDLSSPREKRMARWRIIFDRLQGEAWVRELDGIHAILAIPTGNREYKVIRDLKKRPAMLLNEDVTKINRIYWFASQPEDLARTLGLKTIPPAVVVFIPEELEDQLFKLELSYKGRTEREIEKGNYETEFKLQHLPGGKYEPYVISQEQRKMP